MLILGLVLVILAIGIYMYADNAENVMVKPSGFIIGIVGLYIILKYKNKT